MVYVQRSFRLKDSLIIFPRKSVFVIKLKVKVDDEIRNLSEYPEGF